MGWYQALEEQSDLLRFWRTNSGHQFGIGFQRSLKASNGKPDPLTRGESALGYIEEFKLRIAEPIFVNHEVLDLIEAARERFQPEPLIEQDLLFPAGFVLLPRPVYMPDASGKRMAFRAFAWATAVQQGEVENWTLREHDVSPEAQPGAGIHLSLYSSNDDADDFVKPGGLPFAWTLSHVMPWHFGRDLMGMVPDLGDQHGKYTMDEVQRDRVIEGHRVVWGTVQVLFRLAQQHVLVAPKERAPRPTRRRAARLELPESVSVMHLRKGMIEPGYGEGDGDGTYSHRFMVSGHWRWQWYGSEKVHRQIWINPFIKGPEDRPLVIKKRATNFVR